MEHRFNWALENAGDLEREFERRDVVAFFHGANGLTAGLNFLREFGLRNVRFVAELAEAGINGV